MGMISSIYRRFVRDETPRLAASLAFYTLFAFAPMLLLLISIASLFGLEGKVALVSQVHILVGPEAAAAVKSVISAASERADLRSFVGIFSALIWALSASLLFSELQFTLNRIFGAKESRVKSGGLIQEVMVFLRSRMFSLLMVFAFTLVGLASLLISSYLAFLVRQQSVTVIRAINVLLSFVVYFVFFAGLYKYVPQKKVSYRRAAFGGLITSILFVTGKELIGIYLEKRRLVLFMEQPELSSFCSSGFIIHR